MQVANLILPVFAVIVTGWLAGYLGYVARDLSDALIHFAYNVAMPALLIVTAVLGGLLTLVLLFCATCRTSFSWANVAAVSSLPVPYGAAIAAASTIVTLAPNLP